jgi:hypothetical protein
LTAYFNKFNNLLSGNATYGEVKAQHAERMKEIENRKINQENAKAIKEKVKIVDTP